ncbi:MAG: hypothetical protein WD491_03715 [Balneolales bacterium]
MVKILLLAMPLLFCSTAFGQIEFSTYTESDLVLTQLGSGGMNFGMNLIGEEPNVIELGDEGMLVVAITGVEYYDVTVTIDAPEELEMDSENKIGYTLNAAYANNGQNLIGDATLMNGDMARFQIKRREGEPPGPPPTPPHDGYTPPEATAYLYLYGSIDVGNVAAGEYVGQVHIVVDYD